MKYNTKKAIQTTINVMIRRDMEGWPPDCNRLDISADTSQFRSQKEENILYKKVEKDKYDSLKSSTESSYFDRLEHHFVSQHIISFIMDSNRDFPFYYHGGLHRAFSMLRPITLP